MIHLGMLLLLVALHAWAQGREEERCIVAGESVFTILVGRSGLFGLFGHDHVIEAQDIDGCAVIDPAGVGSTVTLRFPAAGLRVVDPDASAEDRDEVQEKMEDDVLEIERYPDVLFQSRMIEGGPEPDVFRVTGDLTIHGATHRVTIPVTLTASDDDIYTVSGEYRFRQSMYGIKPVRLLGGTVRVKDEIRIEFMLSLRKP